MPLTPLRQLAVISAQTGAIDPHYFAKIETNARFTHMGGIYHFGYKGYISVDVGSKLIRRIQFTPANAHDSQPVLRLISYDEKHTLFGDKDYVNLSVV